MRYDEVLVLERKDLIVDHNKKVIEDITHRDFELSTTKLTIKYNIVLFIDENGRTKIIKNRFGDEGERFNINQLMNKLELSVDRYIEAEKFLVFLSKMKIWNRLFLKEKITKYLVQILKKYKD